jgi:hypothetical protein
MDLSSGIRMGRHRRLRRNSSSDCLISTVNYSTHHEVLVTVNWFIHLRDELSYDFKFHASRHHTRFAISFLLVRHLRGFTLLININLHSAWYLQDEFSLYMPAKSLQFCRLSI